jgi:ABC-type lipoprotein export system ATPase subunit
MGLLQQCKKEFGQTLILVTHNMEYLPLADSLLNIADGKAKEMSSDSVKSTADTLIKEMRQRIHKLIETEKHENKS